MYKTEFTFALDYLQVMVFAAVWSGLERLTELKLQVKLSQIEVSSFLAKSFTLETFEKIPCTGLTVTYATVCVCGSNGSHQLMPGGW